MDAIQSGDEVALRKAIATGADLNYCPYDPLRDGPLPANVFVPLHNACWFGNVRMARMLVEAGADINLRDPNGERRAEAETDTQRLGHTSPPAPHAVPSLPVASPHQA